MYTWREDIYKYLFIQVVIGSSQTLRIHLILAVESL